MSDILSSCCPFLTNAAREGRGSPPYTADAMRLRIHNWTNSLSGATQIPRQVTASSEDKPGLPELSAESSAITFVKSDISIDPEGKGEILLDPEEGKGEIVFDPEEGKGECKVILPVREGYSEMDQAVAAAVAADFHPIPDGDWESEKGLEEEDVTLLERRQAGDDELDITCLERKTAKTVLPLKPQVARHTFEVSSAIPFRSKATLSPSSLHHISEQLLEPVHSSGSKPATTSSASSEEASQETEEPSTFAEHHISPPESSSPSTKPTPAGSYPAQPPLPEDLTQASSSSELLEAISNLQEERNTGATRRSRMTSTRAPTPWSGAEPNDSEDEDGTQDRVAEEEQLERVSSSGSSSLFESIADTAGSSFHTLPTASNSIERADKAGELPGLSAAGIREQLSEQRTTEAETATEKTTKGDVQTAKIDGDAVEDSKAEMTLEAAAEAMAMMEAEMTSEAAAEALRMIEAETTEGTATATTEETSTEPEAMMVTESATEPLSGPAIEAATDSVTEPATELATEPATDPATNPASDPATEPSTESGTESATESGTELQDREPAVEPVTVSDTTDGPAAGDQPPSNIITTADDVNLRYFCGAFRPVDHYMTRYAGLEAAGAALPELAVPSGRSESAVLPPGDGGAGRGRSASSASDSTLPLGARSSSSSPGQLAGEDSGVQLEAKRSSTDIPT